MATDEGPGWRPDEGQGADTNPTGLASGSVGPTAPSQLATDGMPATASLAANRRVVPRLGRGGQPELRVTDAEARSRCIPSLVGLRRGVEAALGMADPS